MVCICPVSQLRCLTVALFVAGQDQRICPYFYSQGNAADADIVLFCEFLKLLHDADTGDLCGQVFMPYNYLLDPQIRSKLKIVFENAVIIFDEVRSPPRASKACLTVFCRRTIWRAFVVILLLLISPRPILPHAYKKYA